MMNVTVTEARRAAFEILRRVEKEGAYASNLLASSRYEQLSREDRALMQELVLGVLRRQSQLDFLIEHFAGRKLNKFDTEVIIALRLGLYQLRFLSRIPQHAALNESVNLVKEQKKLSAAPLVNAVLREAQRTGEIDFSQRPDIETSHPAWLLGRWVSRFGTEEAMAMAMANNTAPRVAFRFNTKKSSEEKTRSWFDENETTIRRSELAPGAWVIESGNLSAQSEPVREGWIYLQDEASQLVAHLIADCGLRIADLESKKTIPSNPQSANHNPQFLDLCAAPGGKTTLIASLLPENALIVAGDLHFHRLRTMRELCARLGVDNINMLQLDATKTLPFAQFDLVLLDAPCSGLGTLQRHPEIKWRMSEAKIGEMAGLQKQLLANASRHVRAGGLLVYSVCSTEPEEGEEVIADFRNDHHEFRDMTRERHIELGIDPTPLLTAGFGARTFTHRQGSESFFVCVLWKRR